MFSGVKKPERERYLLCAVKLCGFWQRMCNIAVNFCQMLISCPRAQLLYFHYLCPMSWFVRIFALYLFVLGCMPCADFEHDRHLQQPVFKAVDSQVFGHHHACADPCSPLCSCACCGCVTISVKSPLFELLSPTPLVEDLQRGFFYQAPLSAAHLAALFRPPINKLG